MLTKGEVIKLLHDNYPALAAEYGVRKLGLFGSYAKGVPNESSDIDLVVEFVRPIGLRFVEFAEHLEYLLGRRVDILTPSGIRGIRIGRTAKEISESIVYV